MMIVDFLLLKGRFLRLATDHTPPLVGHDTPKHSGAFRIFGTEKKNTDFSSFYPSFQFNSKQTSVYLLRSIS